MIAASDALSSRVDEHVLIWTAAIGALAAVVVALIGAVAARGARRDTRTMGTQLHGDHEDVTRILTQVAEDVGASRYQSTITGRRITDLDRKLDAHLEHHEQSEPEWSGDERRRDVRDDDDVVG